MSELTKDGGIVLVDPSCAIRELLREHLVARAGFRVLAEGDSCAKAPSLCQANQPDLLIVDPEQTEALPECPISCVRKLAPNVQILVFTSRNSHRVREAMTAGAHGCVLKCEPLACLTLAIKAVAAGNSFLSPEARALANEGSRLKLSARQREVLSLIASGLSTKEVANCLEISVKTADNHRTRLMKKLDLHDTASVVRFAFTTGLSTVRQTASQFK